MVPSLRCEAYGYLDRSIKVEARIDAESRTVIEEAAAGTFRLRENGIGLRECKIGKRRREEMTGFRREAPNVFGASSRLLVYDRQSIGQKWLRKKSGSWPDRQSGFRPDVSKG